ncbi:hypothetical protein BDB13_3142 [Rhodococcus sp. OK302]|nr:hypothetical protein BDB13_3142 [Rhodococcus sp. OK302]
MKTRKLTNVTANCLLTVTVILSEAVISRPDSTGSIHYKGVLPDVIARKATLASTS